jgi:uncharacterized membrane protein YjjB (DUF3815 family)
MDLNFLLHQTFFGAIAAAGFGVLFNIGFRQLGWCAASGAMALAVRTTGQSLGWSLVAASFAAALIVAGAAHLRFGRTNTSPDIFGVVGCIPLIPGALASKALLGLFAVTRTPTVTDSQILFDAVQSSLRVMFTIFAIGTGMAIPLAAARRRALR